MNLQLDRLDKLHYTLVMEKIQFLTLFKKPAFILGLILLIFFLKGVFLATIFPLFEGQDEARHYDTLQYFVEPKNAVSDAEKNKRRNNNALWEKDNFDTYNFSEEIQKTAAAANINILRGDIFNKIDFSTSYDGKNEAEINSKTWKPYNYYSEPDIASTNSLYHKIASQIEKLFSNQNILFRFYLIRIFSVLLGTFVVLFSYLIAKNIGFSAKHSLLLAAIVSFQPRLSIYFTNINYDALLIPMFFLFTLGGAQILKKGLHWKNITLAILSMAIAVQTKATGYILLIIFLALITYLLYEKVKLRNKNFRYRVYSVCFSAFFLAACFIYIYFLAANFHSINETLVSIGKYISKTITFSNFILPSKSYWGVVGWTNSFILGNATNFIFIIEIMASIGLGLILFSKRLSFKYPDFLPAKKYMLFLFGMIVALQLGVRVADFSAFNKLGGMAMSLGTPGRYFLPNITAHIILVFTGIGVLIEMISSRGAMPAGRQGSASNGRKLFDYSLIIGLILMMAFMMYTIFDVIIYRYYL